MIEEMRKNHTHRRRDGGRIHERLVAQGRVQRRLVHRIDGVDDLRILRLARDL